MLQEFGSRDIRIFGEGWYPHFFPQYRLNKSNASVRVMVEIRQDGRVVGQSPPIHEKIVRMDRIDNGVFSCGLVPPMNNAMIE
jgi:hypothetical protein